MAECVNKEEVLKHCEVLPKLYREAMRLFIKEIPSVNIVRCGECKHWERLNYEAPKEGWCDDQMPYSDGRWVDADDYCNYGEREDE